jgi:hypothetical protein
MPTLAEVNGDSASGLALVLGHADSGEHHQ